LCVEEGGHEKCVFLVTFMSSSYVWTSENVENSDKFYVNIFVPYAMRYTDKSLKASNIFNFMINIPPPVKNLHRYNAVNAQCL